MVTGMDFSTNVPIGHFDMPVWGCFVISGVFLYIGIASLVLRKADPDEHVSMLDRFPSTAVMAIFVAAIAAAPPLMVLVASLS